MKRTIALILTVLLTLACLCACVSARNAVDLTNASSLADLKGAKISAQAGTFHADALKQIPAAETSTYPDFTTLLTALKSKAIDGYIAEEPTAVAVCLEDDTLAYVHLTNNKTGFTATDADVGIAVGLIEGSPLREKINAVLATVDTETRLALMEQMVRISAGETVETLAISSETPAEPEGTFRVAMECAYEPFNWTEVGKKSSGAMPISGEGKDGLYANGYDVQIAKYIADNLNMTLEIVSLDWESLISAVKSGNVDAIIAGMSPTADRELEVDFTDVYYSSNLVIIYNR